MKLEHFEKVIRNKSKEEILIDINATLSVKLNQDDQGPRQCGADRAPLREPLRRAVGTTIPYIPSESRGAEIIGRFLLFLSFEITGNF